LDWSSATSVTSSGEIAMKQVGGVLWFAGGLPGIGILWVDVGLAECAPPLFLFLLLPLLLR